MKILVIGAGIAGLFFTSFMEDADITVIEKNESAGRKLLATGNGRCNFTNLNQGYEFYQSENSDFYKYALDNFSDDDLIDHFNKLGIATTNLASGRCYPYTLSSKTVRDGLFLKSVDNAEFIFNEEVTDINFDKKLVKTNRKSYSYDKLVIATGGITLKNSGSDGKIFDIIKKQIPQTKMTYGITNYKTEKTLSKKAKGTKITGRASLYVENEFIKSSVDDIIFQDYGLTGTAILDISNELSIALSKNKKAYIKIDFFPDEVFKDFDTFLSNTMASFKTRSIYDILAGIINEKLIGDLLKIARVSPDKKAINLNKKDYEMLYKTLRYLRFDVSEINDKTNAQVTIGGIDTRYVSDRTFESTIIKDLHFIGEVLDVSGSCGGYNIQWAASSAKTLAEYLRSLDV